MNDETKDYADELGETEEVVLTRWDKIKQWIEIVVATKKVAVLIWGLIFSAGGAVVVGQATDTTPIRDVAVELGLVQERATQEVSGGDPYPAELVILQKQVADLEGEIEAALNHSHKPVSEPHSHDLSEHTHPPPEPVEEQTAVVPVLIKHEHDLSEHSHPLGEHTHPEVQGVAVGKTEIDDAFVRHIKDDH